MRGYTNFQLHRIIFRAMRLLIALNTLRYGKGASREVWRDLQGELSAPQQRPMAAGA
jgi:hypothetical protein